MANPYQSPGAYAAGVPASFGPSAVIQPTQINMSDIFGRTWTIFTRQWLLALGMTLLVGAFSSIAMMAAFVLGGLMVAGLGEPGAVLFVLAMIAAVLALVWLSIGLAIFALKLVRGQPAGVADLFAGGPYLLRVVVAGLLISLIVMAGTFLCVIPGIIFSLMYSQCIFLIVERNVGVMESLTLSTQLTRGNKLTLFGIWLVVWLVSLVLNMVSCGLAGFFVAPYSLILAAVTYLAMTGQPTADQALYVMPPMR